MRQSILFLVFVCIGFCAIAQTKLDSVQKLEEVTLSDTKLKQYASGFKITKLNDSVLAKNATSLTGLLAFNSNIYFKENGFGMISSPSFRGTNASQTAVIWNGININSQLTGQTDFNTINTFQFNSIDIRSGGGSVQYGSGSIGGTVHLNNKLAFYSHFDNAVKLSYGSFDTKTISYSNDFGSNKWSGNIGVSYNGSENDYKFLGTDKENINGAFNNFNINANLGYFLTDRDVIKLYHQSFVSDRELSGTLVALSNSKYEDENFRTMLEWSRISNKTTSKFNVAHLQELFRYFENKDKDNYSFGKVNTLVLKHNFNFRLSKKLQLQSILDYNYIEGDGSSFGNPTRNVFSTTVLLNHKPTEAISYGVNIRQDFTSSFKSPLVFSLDAGFELSKYYKLKINGSKNYRVPTFNDLFWQPGGSLDLIPESSYQIDLGQEFNYKFANLKLNGFYISTENLIQWRPNTSGIWSPINIAETENYGVEVELRLQKAFYHHNISFTGHYSYTVSEDKATQEQLIYVPFHKGNVSLAYSFKTLSFYYQHLFNDEVFPISRKLLNAYDLGNLGFAYVFNGKGKVAYQLDFKINNIYNKYYENVALRPMPNRNFQIQTTIKF